MFHPATLWPVDPLRAEAYFKEAEAFCDRDGGRLRGIPLYGAMVVADPATGTIATLARDRFACRILALIGARTTTSV